MNGIFDNKFMPISGIDRTACPVHSDTPFLGSIWQTTYFTCASDRFFNSFNVHDWTLLPVHSAGPCWQLNRVRFSCMKLWNTDTTSGILIIFGLIKTNEVIKIPPIFRMVWVLRRYNLWAENRQCPADWSWSDNYPGTTIRSKWPHVTESKQCIFIELTVGIWSMNSPRFDMSIYLSWKVNLLISCSHTLFNDPLDAFPVSTQLPLTAAYKITHAIVVSKDVILNRNVCYSTGKIYQN